MVIKYFLQKILNDIVTYIKCQIVLSNLLNMVDFDFYWKHTVLAILNIGRYEWNFHRTDEVVLDWRMVLLIKVIVLLIFQHSQSDG
jgi:hypothetical protein